METFPALARPRLLAFPFRSLAWLAAPSPGERAREAAARINSFGFRPGRMGSACAFNVNSGTCFESAAISELHWTEEEWCGEAGVR